MKVILFYPKTGFDIPGVSIDLPLSILHVASAITDVSEVVLIDQRVEPDWEDKLMCELSNANILGISSMTCPQITHGIEAAKIARRMSSRTKIVWGGAHPTLFPDQVLESGWADHVVVGRGEERFREMLGYPPAPTEELPYHLLRAGMEKYIGGQGRFDKDTRALIIVTASGCPYKCAYCASSLFPRTSESVTHVIDRVCRLVGQFGINAIAFHDEEFLINTNRSLAIAKGITERLGGRSGGFRWWCQTRMDSLERLGPQGLEILWESGLEAFQPGIESGSERILKMIDKRETVEQFIRINLLLAQYEFSPLYNFIVGFPTETIDEMKETLNLAVTLLDNNPRAQVAGVYILVPYPGTEMFDASVAAGFIPPKKLEDWADFSRQHTLTPWLVGDVKKFVEFASITSRFVDGKRLAKRLQLVRPTPYWNEDALLGLAQCVQKQWVQGDISNVALYKSVNSLILGNYQ